jgi:hypothetical protein
MRKVVLTALLFLVTVCYAQAQTKVFKEVTDEISSVIKLIKQDNTTVGYLSFTRLEKASKDSFNYRISVMDENLNDIGKVEFKEVGLLLKDVSFEQDVLCLGYEKTIFKETVSKSKKGKISKEKTTLTELLTQFVNLNGTIIKTNSYLTASGLGHGVQIKNISQNGFAVFYGNKNENNLLFFNTKGEQLWHKSLNMDAQGFYLLTSGPNIYILSKKNYVTGTTAVLGGYAEVNNEGDFEITGYNVTDSVAETHFALKDEKGNQLKVITFENDPATGKPYAAGCIIDPKKAGKYVSGRAVSKGPYLGVFSININGSKPKEVDKTFTYWSDGMLEGVSKRGKFDETHSYGNFITAFRDFNGNTYFAGPEMIKRIKWGTIASTIFFAPYIIVSPFIIGFGGTTKYKLTDALLVKQNGKGALMVENTLPAAHSRFFRPKEPVPYLNTQSFYTVINTDTKDNYMILDDQKDITIYNVNKKKIVRTIPHKDGRIKTDVYPAKEGHIMVSEYNKKEKYTKVSIEAL